MKTALLLVDIQREYFQDGVMPLESPVEAAVQARRLLVRCRSNHVPAIFIQHIAIDPQAASFRNASPGVRHYTSIRPLPGEAVVRKHYPSAFRDTNLLDLLRAR